MNASITDKWARAELPAHNAKRESVVQSESLKLLMVNYDHAKAEARHKGTEHSGAVEPAAAEIDATVVADGKMKGKDGEGRNVERKKMSKLELARK